MSSCNCCSLTYIQIFQVACQVVWYFHLFRNFSQFVVIHTVKGFGIVNKAEIDVFLELTCFFDDPRAVGNLISCSSAFSELTQDWGNRLWEGTNRTLYAPGPRRKEHWPQKRLACECPGVSGRAMGQQWPAAGLGALSVAVHAWDLLKEVTITFITSTIVWPQVK